MGGVVSSGQESRGGLGALEGDLLKRVRKLEANPGRRTYKIKLFADNEVGTVGDGRFVLIVTEAERIAGRRLVDVSAGVSTVSSSGTITFQVRRVNNTPADILSTALTIDVSEFLSDDAAAAAVINPAQSIVTLGDRYAIDIDVAGANAKGHEVTLVYG